MDNKQKLKLFWKITKHINKKFCKNKLKINSITLFKKGDLHRSFPNKRGWYFSKERQILINKTKPIEMQIIILAHELAHVYQHQILGYEGRVRHDKKGGEVYQKFLKEVQDFCKSRIKRKNPFNST